MPFIGGAIICRSEHTHTHIVISSSHLPLVMTTATSQSSRSNVTGEARRILRPRVTTPPAQKPLVGQPPVAGGCRCRQALHGARSPAGIRRAAAAPASLSAGPGKAQPRRGNTVELGRATGPLRRFGPGRAGPSRGAVRGLRRQDGGRRCQQCRPLGSRGAAGPSRGSGASARQVRGAALPPGAAAEALRAGPAARPRSGHAGRLRPAALGVTAGPERIGSAPWRPPASAARPPGGDSGSPSRPSSSSAAAASSSSFSARPARARPSRHRRPPVEPGAQPGAARGHDGGAERAAARRRRQGESIARPRSAGPGPERAASPCPRPSPGLSGAASLRAGPRPPAPPPPSPPGEAWSRRQPDPRPARVRPGLRPPAPRGLAAAPAAGRALSRPATAPGWVCGPVALVAAGGGGKARCGGCGRACPPLRTGGRCSCARHAEAEQCV